MPSSSTAWRWNTTKNPNPNPNPNPNCMEVEHDDEFMFECEEVELVESKDDALPDGSIDLSNEDEAP